MILGQSGSGKTMTCHSIMGLLNRKLFHVNGSVMFAGQELLGMATKEKSRIYGGEIALIPQNPMTAFDPSMRLGAQMSETLSLHRSLPKRERKSHILNVLAQAGLDEPQRIYRSYPHTLSGGMLQRCTIAMALMVNARLLIADEPTTALDVVTRNATVDAFTTLRNQGAAVLLVTHDFAVAQQLGGHLLVMKDGEIVESGQVQAVLANPQHNYTKALIDAHRLSRSEEGCAEVTAC